MRTLLGVAVVVAVAAAALRPRRRRQARVAATWAAETDRLPDGTVPHPRDRP